MRLPEQADGGPGVPAAPHLRQGYPARSRSRNSVSQRSWEDTKMMSLPFSYLQQAGGQAW